MDFMQFLDMILHVDKSLGTVIAEYGTMVYAMLFGIGKMVFGYYGPGIIMLVIAVLAFAWIARSFRSEIPPPAVAARRPEAVAAD